MNYAIFLTSVSLFMVIFYNLINIAISKAIKIDAFFCISIGYVYYWLIPSLAVIGAIDISAPALDIVRTYIERINENNFILFCFIGAISYTFLFIGTLLFKKKPSYIGDFSKSRWNPPNRIYCKIIILISLFIVAICSYPIKEQFFKGYSPELFVDYADGVTANAIERGRFTASTIFLFITVLIYLSYYTNSIRSFFLNKWMLVYFIAAILVVSLGGRLYFVSTLFALFIYISIYRNATISLKKVITLFCIFALLMTTYGSIRAGGSFNIDGAIVNLLQEPLLTSLSLYSFLSYNNDIVLGNYYLIIADLINIVPSSILPNKLELLIDPRNLGYQYEIPLGAMHVYVSSCIKFGIILIPIISFIFGVFLSLLQRSGYYNTLHAILYSLISSWLVFSFFRDPFYVSLIKNILEFSILLPFFIIFLGRLLVKKPYN